MNDETAFLAAIAASPKDELGYLVFADWLEEQGDPRGAWLRDRAIRAVMGPKAEYPMARIRQKLIDGTQSQQVQKAVLALGADAVEGLMEMVADSDVGERAVWLLKSLDTAAVPMPANIVERLPGLREWGEGPARGAIFYLLSEGSFVSGEVPAALFCDDDSVRYYAIRGWTEGKDEGVMLARLEPCLRSEDATVRCRAVEAIGAMSPAAIRSVLYGMLDDPDPEVVAQALEAISTHADSIPNTESDSVVRFLDSECEAIARLAARILAATRDPRYLPPLENELLKPLPAETRSELLMALGACSIGSSEDLEKLSGRIEDGSPEDVESLCWGAYGRGESLPQGLTPALIARVRRICVGPQTGVNNAMRCLSAMVPPPSEAIQLFQELLLSDDENLVRQVCGAIVNDLRGHGTVLLDELVTAFARFPIADIPSAMAAMGFDGKCRLAEMLPTASPERVRLSLDALFWRRPDFRLTSAQSQAIFPCLYDMNDLEFPFVRGVMKMCRSGIALIPDLTVLTRHLSGQDYLESLLGLGGEIVPHLPALESEMRTRADTSIPLQFIRVLEGLPKHPQAVLPCLRRMLADCDPGGTLAKTGAVPALIQAFGAMGPAARDDIPALLPFLHSGHHATRRKAIVALGRIGGHPGVVPALLACLGDAVPRNRRLAMKALGDLRSREALGELTDRLADADRRTVLTAMTALKRIGDLPAATIMALEAFRMHPDAEVRKRAAEALKTYPPAAFPRGKAEKTPKPDPAGLPLALHSPPSLEGRGLGG